MSNKFTVILDDEDADLLKSLARIFASFQATGIEEPAPAEEAPTTTRRRRAGADAGSSSTEPASDAGASAGRTRRSRSVEGDKAEEVAVEEPVSRRRRSVEPASVEEQPVRRSRRAAPAEDGISDADLTKAASQAAAKITPKVVMQILKEDYGVTTTNDVPKDKRQEFLDTLKYEMEEADKG